MGAMRYDWLNLKPVLILQIQLKTIKKKKNDWYSIIHTEIDHNICQESESTGARAHSENTRTTEGIIYRSPYIGSRLRVTSIHRNRKSPVFPNPTVFPKWASSIIPGVSVETEFMKDLRLMSFEKSKSRPAHYE